MKARFRLQVRRGDKWIDVFCACSRSKVENILRLCTHKEDYSTENYRIVDTDAEGGDG